MSMIEQLKPGWWKVKGEKKHLQTPTGVWVTGPDRVEYVKKLLRRNQHLSTYKKKCNNWWEDYNAEEVVWIKGAYARVTEHMRKQLIQWAGTEPLLVPMKEGEWLDNVRPAAIIVTCRHSLQKIFAQGKELKKAERVFTQVFAKETWNPPPVNKKRVGEDRTQKKVLQKKRKIGEKETHQLKKEEDTLNKQTVMRAIVVDLVEID